MRGRLIGRGVDRTMWERVLGWGDAVGRGRHIDGRWGGGLDARVLYVWPPQLLVGGLLQTYNSFLNGNEPSPIVLLLGNHIEVVPLALFLTRKHALGTKNISVLIAVSQLFQIAVS